MSGGHFDYQQYKIREIADQIAEIIDNQGEEVDNPDYMVSGWHEPRTITRETYPPEVQCELMTGYMLLRIAAIYAQRIDWFLSGDDGEKSFLERIEKDLDELHESEIGQRYNNEIDRHHKNTPE